MNPALKVKIDDKKRRKLKPAGAKREAFKKYGGEIKHTQADPCVTFDSRYCREDDEALLLGLKKVRFRCKDSKGKINKTCSMDALGVRSSQSSCLIGPSIRLLTAFGTSPRRARQIRLLRNGLTKARSHCHRRRSRRSWYEIFFF